MIKLFFQVLLIIMVFFVLGFIYCWITDPSDLSVFTEVGQAKQAARQAEEVEYQEWAKDEDDARKQAAQEKRFRQRYENDL